ncbi:MAG: uroporphyrinogen decarboxylase family protein [Anaerolineaceae bacterium]
MSMPIHDFSQHNEEVKRVWEAYRAGRPVRTPMLLGTNPRIWIQNPDLNREGVTWKSFCEDSELMFNTLLKYCYYLVHTLPQDTEMGVPEKEWPVYVHFGNVVEENWFGCEIAYRDGQVSATTPRFTGQHKREMFEKGFPAPFDGIMGQFKEFYEYFQHRATNYEFYGRPVHVDLPTPLGTDGPFTVALGIRGTQFLEEITTDEDYFHELMSFVTQAIIARIQAWRKYIGVEERPLEGGLADDAIQFLSVSMYKEKVLPYHRQFFEALYGPGPHSMHLCGNVQRHLPTLVKEFNIQSFETGYPINFSSLRGEIGETVEIQGGIPVAELLEGSPAEVYRKTETILHSGIRQGGKFIMREANNLPPCVPLENLQAMYSATRQAGVFTK